MGLPEGVDRTVVLPPPDLDADEGIPETHLGQHIDESTPEGRIARLQRLREQGFITEEQLREGIARAKGQ